MASVSVSVTAEDGTPITDAMVTYSVDGVEMGACEAWPGGGWVCGFEVPGHFVVTATAVGYEPASAEVDIAMDAQGCHVLGEAVTLTLVEAACEGDAVTSVYATLVGSSGEALDHPAVSWRPADIDDAPWEACHPSELGWECGIEVAGRLDIMGTAGGHTIDYALADVPMTEDGCHVVTQEVDLVVEWLPD